jgi:ankyrin repeat protein
MENDLGKLARTPAHVDRLQAALRSNPEAQEWRDSDGSSVLHLACGAGNVNAVRAILQIAPHLCSSLNGSSSSALHFAVLGPSFVQTSDADYSHGMISTLSCVNLLLAAGASSTKLNAAGQSPLHVAAAWGRCAVVHRLAIHGSLSSAGEHAVGTMSSTVPCIAAVLDEVDAAGRSALHLALLGRASACSADDAPIPPGSSSARRAQWGYYSPDVSPPQLIMARWLLQQGVDAGRHDIGGQLPIHVALRRGAFHMALLLAAACPPTLASKPLGVPAVLTAVQHASSLTAQASGWRLALAFRSMAVRLAAAAALLPIASPGMHAWPGATASSISRPSNREASQRSAHAAALAMLLGAKGGLLLPVTPPQLHAAAMFLLQRPAHTVLLGMFQCVDWLNLYGAGLLWPVFSVLLWRDYESEVLPWLSAQSWSHAVFRAMWVCAWALYLTVFLSDPGTLVAPQGWKRRVLQACRAWPAEDSSRQGCDTPAALHSTTRDIVQDSDGVHALPEACSVLGAAYAMDVHTGQGGAAEYCATCGIVRPHGSKHDTHTDVCVALFDHWCPWTANAVGRANYPAYLLFVLCASATGLLWLLLYSVHLATCKDSCPSPWWPLLVTITQPAWMTAFGVLLCVQHARLVGKGVTTNEALGWRKYRHMQRQPMHKPNAPIPVSNKQLYSIPAPRYVAPRSAGGGLGNWRLVARRCRLLPWVLTSCLANAAGMLQRTLSTAGCVCLALQPLLLLCCSQGHLAAATACCHEYARKAAALCSRHDKAKQEDAVQSAGPLQQGMGR